VKTAAHTLWLEQLTEDEPSALPKWTAKTEEDVNAEWVLVSQDCDINARPDVEPRVEVVTARWSTDPTEILQARKGNSSRLFLLSEENERALLADARRRAHLKKESLLAAGFATIFSTEPERMRFARWVAGRYDRPAIPDQIVKAVHKPIMKSLESVLKKREKEKPEIARLKKLLNEAIEELRFHSSGAASSLTIDFLLIVGSTIELSAEEEAVLSGWLEDVVVTKGSPVEAIRVAFFNVTNLSVADYLATTRLMLDQYSPEDVDVQIAADVGAGTKAVAVETID
jgi:hypothetical protein